MNGNNINVFVHGLFFMRMPDDPTTIELVAPKLTPGGIPHKFLGGVRAALQPLQGNVDWTKIGLTGKTGTRPSPENLPNSDLDLSIPQFSLTSLQLGGWKLANFFGSITLPWPLHISSVRCDDLKNFKTQRSNVGAEILDRCGSGGNTHIGFITCLQYTYSSGISLPSWAPGMNLHCYFEPCLKHHIADVNDDLTDAQNIFVSGANFDLQMDPSAESLGSSPHGLCANPPGFQPDDDLSLSEDQIAKKGVCDAIIQAENLNPSNCPNFFVGP